jgi:glycyl-tRNA synthetase
MSVTKADDRMEKLVSLCKRRGFIFQSSEIYGGLNGFWDYGPLGTELKRNVKACWWRSMTQLRDDVVGLDASIIMHPMIWKASGHVETFNDPMLDCKTCKGRFRADQLDEIPCPLKPSNTVARCTGEKTPVRNFNLMFKTHVGPIESDDNLAYLRPETAQAIFVQYKTVLEVSRQKLPFGVAQMGKAFRNEVTPRNFTFRSREFEQMELEFFIPPDEAIEAAAGPVARVSGEGHPGSPQPNWGWEVWHKYWVEERIRFYESIGLPRESLEEYWQKPEELAHYAKATVDILYKFPFGTQELEGIAARGDFDLTQHQKHSGKPMDYFDEETKAAWARLDDAKREAFQRNCAETRRQALLKKGVAEAEAKQQAEAEAKVFCEKLAKGLYVPHVIEPSAGVDRLILALLCNAYHEEQVPDEKGKLETRVVMKLHPRIAPIKVAVFPLLKNRPELVQKARAVRERLRPHLAVFYDESGAIGRRYRRQDEAGTPFGVTIDFETLGEKGPELKDTVTLRDRDSMQQVRIKIDELLPQLLEKIR